MIRKRTEHRNLLLIIVALLLLSGIFAPEYQLDLLATAVLYGLFATSVDFSYGYAGILNMGSALYFGLGAYITGYGLKAGINPILLILIGMAVSVAIALIIGYVGFRVKASQVHFGIIGLALTLGFEQLTISLYDITGGSNGITNVPRPTFSLFGMEWTLTSPTVYYYFVICVVLLSFFLLWKLANSDFGRAMLALRHDETKMETMGYNPLKVKMSVTGITAAFSALSGALFVPISGIAYPGLFGVTLSMSVLIWVALGGTGTLIGPFILGALLKLSESTLSSNFEEIYMLIIGLIFVTMVILAPEGAINLLKRLIGWFTPQRSKNAGN
ncbi:branched-chain amino acid ABC transporter permease [Brevibacillus massiliensis]|uniref:branched-chain amino acid ABC transporter permease n=1 Tax=Brevibacillus massiliensis TaxID=1118054 RepID=UPI000375FE49|nr:branched-chain amino acid ABC transporter permease [Brevibacillus massiliensis]